MISLSNFTEPPGSTQKFSNVKPLPEEGQVDFGIEEILSY